MVDSNVPLTSMDAPATMEPDMESDQARAHLDWLYRHEIGLFTGYVCKLLHTKKTHEVVEEIIGSALVDVLILMDLERDGEILPRTRGEIRKIILTLLHHHCVDYQKWRARDARAMESMAREIELTVELAALIGEEEDEMAAINRLLSHLSEDQRECIRRLILREEQPRAFAEGTGRTLDATYKLKSLAVKELRARCEAAGITARTTEL